MPTSAGGLNLLSIGLWNKAVLWKLLWNLCNKKDKLWIQWVPLYYIKGGTVGAILANQASWLLGNPQSCHLYGRCWTEWIEEMGVGKFSIRQIYLKFMGTLPTVSWRKLVCSKPVLPKWVFMVYLLANGKVYTKDRLIKWGIDVEPQCKQWEGQMKLLGIYFFIVQ